MVDFELPSPVQRRIAKVNVRVGTREEINREMPMGAIRGFGSMRKSPVLKITMVYMDRIVERMIIL